MKVNILFLLFIVIISFSCEQGSKTTRKEGGLDKADSAKEARSYNLQHKQVEKYVDTRYDYIDPSGARITVQNSFPKGGQKYTDPNGKEYVYAVFWTRILNETSQPFELNIDFPAKSYDLSSEKGIQFKMVFPTDAMTADAASLFNYGLSDLESGLNDNLNKPSIFKKTIKPKDSGLFYFVVLTNRGLDGTLRTGFSIEKQDLIYRINGMQIFCGKVGVDLRLE